MDLNATYNIPLFRLARFEEQIEKLNKKAKKLGVKEITFKTHGRTEIEFRRNLYQKPEKVACEIVTMEGEAPKLNGWIFLGTLTPFKDDENLVKSVAGFRIPDKYKTAVGICEHCDKIRKRKLTYVVYNEQDMEYKAVGKSCLKDFLGHKDPHSIARWSEWLCDLQSMMNNLEDDDMWGGEYSNDPQFNWIDLEDYLLDVVVVIRNNGFVSGKKEYESNGYETSTATLVGRMRNSTSEFFKYFVGEDKKENYKRTEEDKQQVKAIIEWGKNLDSDEEYFQNIKLICETGRLTGREAGLTASMPTAYYFATKEDAKRSPNKYASEFVGEVGDKIVTKITVNGAFPVNSSFGTSYLHNCQDENGNIITWFNSGSPSSNLEPGKTYEVTGTVKGCQLYKGQKQTLLKRVKVVK